MNVFELKQNKYKVADEKKSTRDRKKQNSKNLLASLYKS